MRRIAQVLPILMIICILTVLFIGCDAGIGGRAEKDSGEITVLLPPWSEPPKELVEQFESESGIKVNLNIMGWDEIHDKITIAAASNTAPADVIEVDWSWVSEFKQADCVEPLTLTDEQKAKFPLLDSFTIDGTIIAIPYLNDFRVGFYNTEHLEKAGISAPPETWEELIDQAKQIKNAGIVNYPMAFTLSPTEGTTTQFFWLTLSTGGSFFNNEGKLNKEDALKSLKLVDSMVREHQIIDPAMASMRDVETSQYFLNGSASFTITAPDGQSAANDPERSKVVGKVNPMLIPGGNGNRTATFGLPGAMGIAKHSKNKVSARKFIDWYTSDATATELFNTLGLLPANIAAMEPLVENGEIEGGDVILEQAKTTVNPFPVGVPSWYAEFSILMSNLVNSMVQGNTTPEEVVEEIDNFINKN